MNNCGYFIVSLFLFLQEFTRIKWSENENKEREREKNFFIVRGILEWKIFGFSQIEGVNKVYNI